MKADILKAAGLVIDQQDRLLVSKDIGVVKWTIMGGRIEEGETEIECLTREFIEEMNVEILAPIFYCATPIFPAASHPEQTVKIYCYFIKLKGEPKIKAEIELLHWLTKNEFESGKFEFSETMQKFLLPKLIEDGHLK